ncbi:MAG: type II toxin-antitoxin system VapC family toxin [Luteolibacter sp.]
MEMIAVDTNVIIRFLVDDNPAEGKRARRLFETHRVLVPESVLLESEWVLRAVYGFSRDEISRAFRALLQLTNVIVDDRAGVMQVFDWFDEGFDFADALHYARSTELEFKTFDRKFLNKGKKHRMKITEP